MGVCLGVWSWEIQEGGDDRNGKGLLRWHIVTHSESSNSALPIQSRPPLGGVQRSVLRVENSNASGRMSAGRSFDLYLVEHNLLTSSEDTWKKKFEKEAIKDK